jgi:DNA-binding transcriptional ArsR family regulator
MKKISLSTKQELDIYMNPTRQQILRQLSLSGTPMTPKMLADKLKISASGVQHHLKKLISLGVVELDHTEMIHGITASFYKLAPVQVQIGLEKDDDLDHQREVLIQNSVFNILSGFQQRLQKAKTASEPINSTMGDVMTGVVYLTPEASADLMKMIEDFIRQHSTPRPNTQPWEYALIAYNAKENA